MKTGIKLHLKLSLIIAGMAICLSANAKVHIKGLGFSKMDGHKGRLSVLYKGKIVGEPELSVRDSIIQIEVPGAVVWPKIEKKITLGKKKFDTTLMAYQYDKDLARVRILLPFSAAKNNHKIDFEVGKNRIDIRFPTKKPLKSADALKYDEAYLEELLKDKKETKKKATVAKAISNDLSGFLKKKGEKKTMDEVKRTSSSVKKGGKWDSGFSIGNFVGKVVGFFAVILLAFYVLVAMVKKGVFKKSKLGFLNNTKAVQVLSTTYIAPKRSVMMIQAHDQVFLIGNSERGMHFLSEVNNVTGLMKNGEKELSGTNFDTDMVSAGETGKEQVIKEDITKSQSLDSPLTSFLNGAGEETEKLSDKIKSKVKNLKSLQ